MRIVHLVANLDVGGLERQVIELAVEQRKAGHDPFIYSLFHEGALAGEARARGIPLISFEKPPGLSVSTILRLIRQLRVECPEVLHTHNAVVHHYGVAAAKWCRVSRVINTQHGSGTLTQDRRLSRIFLATMPWTDWVVMVSEEVRSCLIDLAGLPAHKSHVIRNGIPLDAFRGFRADPGVRFPKIRFGTVGRLAAVKDHRTLIAAFRQVLDTMPFAELHIAGDGPLRGRLTEEVRSFKLEESVWMHGTRGDVGQFLSGLDIFVLSSLTEGLPVALLEAVAVGLPVVSTRVGEVPEVTAAGVAEYCRPGRAEDLARAMLKMANRTDLAAIGRRASSLASEFGIDRTSDGYLSLMQRPA